MTADEFAAAGLYDPAAPAAADRLALLESLVAQGVPLEFAEKTIFAAIG